MIHDVNDGWNLRKTRRKLTDNMKAFHSQSSHFHARRQACPNQRITNKYQREERIQTMEILTYMIKNSKGMG